MDVRLTGLSSLIFLTAWLTPRQSHTSDFRNSFRPLTIAINRSSPAFAAIEAERANAQFSNYNTETGLADRSIKYIKLKTRPQPVAIQLPALVISRKLPTDHLTAMVESSATENDPTPSRAAASPANMSLDQYANYLVQKELARRKSQINGEETIKGQYGTPILVARASDNLRALLPTREATTNGLLIAQNSVRAPADLNRPLAMPLLPSKQFHVAGTITMAGGAGYVAGDQQILIHHVVNGLTHNSGTLDPTSGRFAINTDDLSGQIVAEVRDAHGQLLAQGAVDLPKNNNKSVNISVLPVFSGTAGEVVSTNALGSRPKAIPDATLIIRGIERIVPYISRAKAYLDDLLVQPSNYIVEATHRDYWPSLALAESGEKFQTQLFQNQFLESFLQLTLDKYAARDAENMGLIWGKVTMQGEPIEGAKVSLVGENAHAPVYFTGFIPDLARKTTSLSGEFAFSSLNPVETAVQVSLGKKSFWPVLLPIQPHTVSYADLRISPPRDVDFSAAEAFSNAPKRAAVVPLGTSDEFFVPEQGSHQKALQTVKGMTLLEAKTDNQHAVTRRVLHSNQTRLTFPFLRNAWLRYMIQKSAAVKLPNNDVSALFFVTGDDYDVTIGSGGAHPGQKIAYFNSKGQFSAKPTIDGGFIVFGLPRGFQTITMSSSHTKKVVTRLVYADDYAVAVSSVNLGY